MNAVDRVARQNFVTKVWLEWRRQCAVVPAVSDQVGMLGFIGAMYDSSSRDERRTLDRFVRAAVALWPGQRAA